MHTNTSYRANLNEPIFGSQHMKTRCIITNIGSERIFAHMCVSEDIRTYISLTKIYAKKKKRKRCTNSRAQCVSIEMPKSCLLNLLQSRFNSTCRLKLIFLCGVSFSFGVLLSMRFLLFQVIRAKICAAWAAHLHNREECNNIKLIVMCPMQFVAVLTNRIFHCVLLTWQNKWKTRNAWDRILYKQTNKCGVNTRNWHQWESSFPAAIYHLAPFVMHSVGKDLRMWRVLLVVLGQWQNSDIKPET